MMIIIMIINAKRFRKRCLCAIPKRFFKNKLTFMKKAVIHATTLMHCKARQVFATINQGNGSEITFAAGATKVHVKNLKT